MVTEDLATLAGLNMSEVKRTFPSVVRTNKSPHSIKMCFTADTSDSEWAMNLRSVSSRVKVVVLYISSAWLTPNRRNDSEFDVPAFGGQTSATYSLKRLIEVLGLSNA